jgi:hypothetical protein
MSNIFVRRAWRGVAPNEAGLVEVASYIWNEANQEWEKSTGGGGGGGGSSVDRELVQTTYRVRTAFTGASVGDIITLVQILDVSATPSTVSSIWRNQTTAADLGSAPSAANLEIVGAQALTAAQLEAASITLNTANLQNTIAAEGAAQPTHGQVVMGHTGAGNVRHILVDANGRQIVNINSSALPTGAATSAAQTTGNTSLASIDTKTPTLDNAKQPVIPSMTSGGNLSAQTNATGTNFTSFGSQALKQLTISNQTGVPLEFQQGGAGVALPIPNGAFYTFYGITNSNQLGVRRVDQSNTQVTVQARWES